MESRYRPGTIVHARGREWIVLPPREPEVLQLRPLTTAQGDEVGLFLPLEGERVRPARFTSRAGERRRRDRDHDPVRCGAFEPALRCGAVPLPWPHLCHTAALSVRAPDHGPATIAGAVVDCG